MERTVWGRFRNDYCKGKCGRKGWRVEMWLAILFVIVMFAAIVGMLFVALVTGLAAADRARVRVSARHPHGARR